VDICVLYAKIEALLDEKIEGLAITAPLIAGDEAGGRVDLSSGRFRKAGGHICPTVEDGR
jgi:type I restriction enzyme R subunit